MYEQRTTNNEQNTPAFGCPRKGTIPGAIFNFYQLSTINYQLSTINYQNYQLSTINYQLSTVNCQLST